MAAHSPAALTTPALPDGTDIGRWSLVLAGSIAGLALAASGMRAGWPLLVSALALTVHGGLAVTGGWHLYLAGETHRELLEELAALEAERSALRANAADVAHDMRAPIVTVRSYLELLSEEAFGPLPEAARHAAQHAARASTRAHSLVESVLANDAGLRDVARASVEAARVSAPAAVDLTTVVGDVIASLDAEIAAAGARIRVGTLPRVAADEAACYRIFENLVENAIRYRRPGAAPRIAIDATTAAGAVEIAVRDDGIGIAADDRERVFLRGVRLGGRQDDGDGDGGHGLGLATVRDLVTSLDGAVWIDPGVRDGTCVRVRLPR